MWSEARDRRTSPVLVKTISSPYEKAYELTLPEGEGHPFWRVTERRLSRDDLIVFYQAREKMWGKIGDLHEYDTDDHTYMRVRGYVFNGRKENGWDVSVEKVRGLLERVE